MYVMYYYLGEEGNDYPDSELHEIEEESLIHINPRFFESTIITQVVITTDIWSN